MRQRSFCLKFAAAILLIINSARLSVAPFPRLFGRKKIAEPSKAIARQQQVNADLQAGWEKTPEELAAHLKELDITKQVILLPEKTPRPVVVAYAEYRAKKKFFTIPIKQFTFSMLGKEKAILIGGDAEIKSIYEEGLKHDCVVSLIDMPAEKDMTVEALKAEAPDISPRAFPILTQKALDAEITEMNAGGQKKKKKKPPPSIKKVLKILVEGGITTFYFAWEDTAFHDKSPVDRLPEEDNLDNLLTKDFREFVKLTKAQHLHLKVVSFHVESDVRTFETYKQGVVNLLKMIGIDKKDIYFTNSQHSPDPEAFFTKYLNSIVANNKLSKGGSVYIDNKEWSAKKAAADGFLAMHASGPNGFDITTLKPVEWVAKYRLDSSSSGSSSSVGIWSSQSEISSMSSYSQKSGWQGSAAAFSNTNALKPIEENRRSISMHDLSDRTNMLTSAEGGWSSYAAMRNPSDVNPWSPESERRKVWWESMASLSDGGTLDRSKGIGGPRGSVAGLSSDTSTLSKGSRDSATSVKENEFGDPLGMESTDPVTSEKKHEFRDSVMSVKKLRFREPPAMGHANSLKPPPEHGRMTRESVMSVMSVFSHYDPEEIPPPPLPQKTNREYSLTASLGGYAKTKGVRPVPPPVLAPVLPKKSGIHRDPSKNEFDVPKRLQLPKRPKEVVRTTHM